MNPIIGRNLAAVKEAISEAGPSLTETVYDLSDMRSECSRLAVEARDLKAELCQAHIDGVAVADRNCLLSAKLEAAERRCEEEKKRAREFFEICESLKKDLAASRATASAMDDENTRLAERCEELEKAIRTHRDQRGDDRCWLDDRELYRAIGSPDDHDASLPPKCDFLKSCERFWEQRQTLSDKFALKHMTIRQLQNRIADLESRLAANPLKSLADEVSDDVVKLVAIAIRDHFQGKDEDFSWDKIPYRWKAPYLRQARAAIAAYEQVKNSRTEGKADVQ